MKDFEFNISTKILFGKDQLKNLPKEIKKYGNKVLLIYGKSSIKRIGLYDKIVELFDENDIELFEVSGVVPNPRIDKVREAVDLAKKEKVDFILAAGGGSTIDTAKLTALGAKIDEDPWEIVIGKAKAESAIPLGSILTLSATGSEMNTSSVITNEETGQKLGWGDELCRPKFAIMDPELTYSVNDHHTAAGTADIMSHTMENYFSLNDGCYMQDRMAEGILKTAIKYGPIAMKEAENYEARANLMWAGSWAINGLLNSGKDVAWSVHPIEHELSALRDITHGYGLATLTPYWLEYCLEKKTEETKEKIANFGYNVFDLDKTDSLVDDAKAAINALREFFTSMGIPEKLRDYDFEEEDLAPMAHNCMANRSEPVINGFIKLEEEDVLEIYKAAF